MHAQSGFYGVLTEYPDSVWGLFPRILRPAAWPRIMVAITAGAIVPEVRPESLENLKMAIDSPMKKSLLALMFMGGAAIACGSTNSEPVDLPEMKAVSDGWTYVEQRVLPVYPIDLRRSGETGKVSLEIVVDQKGRVKAVNVLDSDNSALSAAAREAVRQWKFVPAEKTAMNDVRHAFVTFSFELEQAA